jgi:hypothetical protein
MNPATRAKLADAIERDHPCDDYGCDIAMALKHGYTEAAATLLTSATETPAVDEVIRRYNLNIGNIKSPAFDRWADWHHAHKIECPGCEGFSYWDDDYRPATCSNCLAALPGEDTPDPGDDSDYQEEDCESC